MLVVEGFRSSVKVYEDLEGLRMARERLEKETRRRKPIEAAAKPLMEPA